MAVHGVLNSISSNIADTDRVSQSLALTRPGLDRKSDAQPVENGFAPLLAIGLGIGSMLLGLALFGDAGNPLVSLVATSLAGLGGLWIIARVHYARYLGRALFFWVAVIYGIKIIIGVVHYTSFFEPNYFTQPLGYFSYSYDYGQLPEGMQIISRFWHMYGFVDVPATTLGAKSFWLLNYHSLLYYFGGEYTLNLTPWAAFHTILVAFLVTSLALQKGATRKQAWVAFGVAAFSPLFLYADLPQRDIVGQFWVALAIYLMIQSLNRPRRLIWLFPLSAILVYSQRVVYPIVLAAFVLAALAIARHRWKTLVVVLILTSVVVVWLGPTIVDVTVGRYSELSEGGISDTAIGSVASLPAAIIVGIIGPFPWTQILDVPNAIIHLPAEFLQVWLTMALWLIVLPRAWRQWQDERTIDEGVLAASLFMASGMLTIATHTGYTNVAIVFLLPVACLAEGNEWRRKLLISALIYGFLHAVFWALGLGGQGAFGRG